MSHIDLGTRWIDPAPHGRYQPPPVSWTRSLQRRATAASVSLLVMASVCLAGAASSFRRASLYGDVLAGSPGVTRDDFRMSEKWVLGAWATYFLGQIVVGVLFIRWQHRHARNAQAIAGRSGFGPGWAIGGWFVPVANMVLPAVELFRSSRITSGRSSPLIPLWMATFTVGGWIMALLSVRPFPGPPFDTDDQVRDGRFLSQLAVGGFLLLAIAAIRGTAMVRLLTRRQVLRLAVLPGQVVPPGAQAMGQVSQRVR